MSDDAALLVEAKRLRAKKRFSQNFLVDESVLSRIVSALDLKPGETVLEIGPGPGFLTQFLMPGAADVAAVEVERSMCMHLRRKFSAAKNFTLYEEDILKFSFDKIKSPQLKIVGNLPYSITSPILFHLIGELDDLNYPLRKRATQITLMVQKEVAERITAKPGTKPYNHLSIALQYWCETRYEFTVPPQAFYPRPKVESAVISLFPRKTPLYEIEDLAFFARLVRCVFQYKRKTLKNALQHAGLVSPDLVKAGVLDTIFSESGIAPEARAETLGIPQFGQLAHALRQHTRQG